jgi:hypothetical protein
MDRWTDEVPVVDVPWVNPFRENPDPYSAPWHFTLPSAPRKWLQNLKHLRRGLAALLGAFLLTPASVSAQPALAGKPISIIVGFGSGGSYDLWA